jgi:hypothetical protein
MAGLDRSTNQVNASEGEEHRFMENNSRLALTPVSKSPTRRPDPIGANRFFFTDFLMT